MTTHMEFIQSEWRKNPKNIQLWRKEKQMMAKLDVTILDTETGEKREAKGIPILDLTTGNWSCDCNRMLLFGDEVVAEMDKRMRVKFPDLKPHQRVCWATYRFLVVDSSPLPGSLTLQNLNDHYPIYLLREHGVLKSEKAIDEFIQEIVTVCKKHGIGIFPVCDCGINLFPYDENANPIQMAYRESV